MAINHEPGREPLTPSQLASLNSRIVELYQPVLVADVHSDGQFVERTATYTPEEGKVVKLINGGIVSIFGTKRGLKDEYNELVITTPAPIEEDNGMKRIRTLSIPTHPSLPTGTFYYREELRPSKLLTGEMAFITLLANAVPQHRERFRQQKHAVDGLDPTIDAQLNEIENQEFNQAVYQEMMSVLGVIDFQGKTPSIREVARNSV